MTEEAWRTAFYEVTPGPIDAKRKPWIRAVQKLIEAKAVELTFDPTIRKNFITFVAGTSSND
jgi:hypothetical protein